MADFFITQQPTAVWEANNPTLQANELGVCSDLRNGVETDTGIARLGNGVDAWNDLPNFNPTASSQVLFSYLGSTVTYNNTAALADTALSVTVAAGGIYDIEVLLHSTSVVSALVVNFGGTATFTNFIGQWQSGLSNAEGSPIVPTGMKFVRVTSAATDFNNDAVGGAPDGYYLFQGTAEINAAGTLLIRGAQSGADASNTTILRGSCLILTRMN